jgi:hypothetical protein
LKAGKLFVGIAILAVGILAVFFWIRSSRTQSETQVLDASRGERSEVKLPVPSSSPSSLPQVSEHDQHLLTELNQILASKNDNDHRLDTDFKNLTPGTKTLLMKRYQELPSEKRNDRGTIVFLIGRELNRPEDFRFLAQVGMETPCLSMIDCKQEMHQTPEELHEQSTISVTLAYPQHVAMKSLENLLSPEKGAPSPDQAQISEALNTLETLGNSPLPFIAQCARDDRTQFASLKK